MSLPEATGRSRETNSADAYWSLDAKALLRQLDTSPAGLTSAEAARRQRRYGRNRLHDEQSLSRLRVLWRQLASPVLLLLIIAAAIAAAVGELTNAAIVVTIIGASVGIGYQREYRANAAAAALKQRIHARDRKSVV